MHYNYGICPDACVDFSLAQSGLGMQWLVMVYPDAADCYMYETENEIV